MLPQNYGSDTRQAGDVGRGQHVCKNVPMPRTFIAARIAETPALRHLYSRLSCLGDAFRPIPLTQLHLTVKFLGDTGESQLADVTAILQRAAARHSAADVALHGLGAFPHVERPSIVWIGMRGADSLCSLAADLERELEPLGFVPEEREFHPHITVLRVKRRPPPDLFSMLDELAAAGFGSVPIDAVELFQSDLGPRGPRYTVLAKASLRLVEQSA